MKILINFFLSKGRIQEFYCYTTRNYESPIKQKDVDRLLSNGIKCKEVINKDILRTTMKIDMMKFKKKFKTGTIFYIADEIDEDDANIFKEYKNYFNTHIIWVNGEKESENMRKIILSSFKKSTTLPIIFKFYIDSLEEI